MSAQPLQAPSAPAHRTSAQAVSSYWRAWSEHNLNDLLELLAPDFISRSSLSQGRATGKEAIAKGFAMFDKALPDLREEITSLVTADNSVVCEVEETATFTGPMHLGAHVIAPTNRSYTLPVASFFRINAQGLIAEQRLNSLESIQCCSLLRPCRANTPAIWSRRSLQLLLPMMLRVSTGSFQQMPSG
jgi:ketosteroid isomerase-like protein